MSEDVSLRPLVTADALSECFVGVHNSLTGVPVALKKTELVSLVGGLTGLISGRVLISSGTNTAESSTVTTAELGVVDGVTPGTAASSKALVLGTSGEIGTITTAVITTANIATVNAGAIAMSGALTIKRATVAAAGTVAANGTSITGGFTSVTASDGAKGIVLPVGSAGLLCIVANTVAGQNLKVWPASGAAIDAGSPDAAATVAGSKTQMFIADSATQWWSILTA